MWFSWRKRDHLIDTLIKAPVYSFTKADESLARAARARRVHADAIRTDAIRVEQKQHEKPFTRVVSLRLSDRQDLPRRATGR